MDVNFAVLRYQPDLSKDDWIPLGIVTTSAIKEGTIIAVACLQSVEAEHASELARAILQDIPAVLRKEIESSCARFRPGDNFLEVLRASNPWNLHFSVPKRQSIAADDIL